MDEYSLAENVASSAVAENIIPSQKLEILAKRVTKLLLMKKSLGVTAKAERISSSHQNVLNESEIFTDIRSIFIDSVVDNESIGAVYHTLKLSYFSSGSEKEIYVALDKDDLDQLAKLISIAEKNEEVLKQKPLNLQVQ